MADTLTTRKLLGQLLVGVLIVVGLAVVGTLLSLFALNHFGGIQGLRPGGKATTGACSPGGRCCTAPWPSPGSGSSSARS